MQILTFILGDALSQAEDREIQQHEIKLIDAQKSWVRLPWINV